MLPEKIKKMQKTRTILFSILLFNMLALPISTAYYSHNSEDDVLKNTSYFMPLYFSFAQNDYIKLNDYISKNDGKFIKTNFDSNKKTLTIIFPENIEEYHDGTSYGSYGPRSPTNYNYNYETSKGYSPYKLFYNTFYINNKNIKKVIINGVEVPKNVILESWEKFVNQAGDFYTFLGKLIDKNGEKVSDKNITVEFLQ